MNHLNYRELKKENQADCALFEEMMWPYTKELDQHAEREMPREVIKKWVASIIRMLGDADRHLELVFDGEVPVGFLYGKVDHPDHRGYIKPGWGYVMEFYVKPEFRRMGYGREMNRRLEALFRADGVKNLYLTADPVTGRPFWEAMGYHATGEIMPENKMEIYEKELKTED